jgi:hypothetical protein
MGEDKGPKNKRSNSNATGRPQNGVYKKDGHKPNGYKAGGKPTGKPAGGKPTGKPAGGFKKRDQKAFGKKVN